MKLLLNALPKATVAILHHFSTSLQSRFVFCQSTLIYSQPFAMRYWFKEYLSEFLPCNNRRWTCRLCDLFSKCLRKQWLILFASRSMEERPRSKERGETWDKFNGSICNIKWYVPRSGYSIQALRCEAHRLTPRCSFVALSSSGVMWLNRTECIVLFVLENHHGSVGTSLSSL